MRSHGRKCVTADAVLTISCNCAICACDCSRAATLKSPCSRASNRCSTFVAMLYIGMVTRFLAIDFVSVFNKTVGRGDTVKIMRVVDAQCVQRHPLVDLTRVTHGFI